MWSMLWPSCLPNSDGAPADHGGRPGAAALSFLVYLGISHGGSGWALILLGLFALRFWPGASPKLREWLWLGRTLAGVGVALTLLTLLCRDPLWLLYYPVVVNLPYWHSLPGAWGSRALWLNGWRVCRSAVACGGYPLYPPGHRSGAASSCSTVRWR